MRYLHKMNNKKKLALFLTGTLALSNITPYLANTANINLKDIENPIYVLESGETSTTSSILNISSQALPQQDTTYTYDFSSSNTTDVIIPVTYDSSHPIDRLESPDQLVTINGNGTMYHHGDTHGLVVKDGNSFDVKVAGNAIITFELCKYSKGGSISATADTIASDKGKFSKDSINLVGSADKEEVEFIYQGEAATLTFTINGGGTNYLHGFTVKNTSEPVDITIWEQKDFSISLGDETINITGAKTQSELAAAAVSNGQVYYALSDNSYISTDLKGAMLKASLLTNNSPETVDSLEVNSEGEIVVHFTDQTSYPYTYTIKVQDQGLFEVPGVADVYSFDYAAGAVPKEFTTVNRIKESYTTDNGILTVETGSGSKSPYWHDSTHGLALYNGNYIEVKVAGDAAIIFAGCQHGAEGKFNVTNLPEGASGNFDTEQIKGTCNGSSTYTYTGSPATLRFTLDSPGEVYLHGTTVKNTGEITDSPVANEQVAMPHIVDSNGTLSVVANGHRLLTGQDDKSASVTALNKMGYYLFDSMTEACTLEADIKILSVGSTSSQGIFVGMFEEASEGKEISNIATLGIRGDGKIRNMYNKAGASLPSAGSIDKTYAAGDTIHIKVQKTNEGWYSAMTTSDDFAEATIKYSATDLMNDINAKVHFGFGFANVNAVITNLTLTDSEGVSLYSQTECYDAVGTPPTVVSVEDPVLSKDRTQLSVSWEGGNCKEDAAYQVELSKDGGKNYRILSKSVTEKTYTADIDSSGEFVFRITGVCGKVSTPSMFSSSLTVLAPMESPVLSAESGDSAITLNWNQVADAEGYEIYRRAGDESDYKLIRTVDSLVYVDADVVNEVPYYYYIIAKSASNFSNPSNEILTVPTAGREGNYAYGEQAAELFITKKSYDTVYKNQALIEGIIDQQGSLVLEVNGIEQESILVNKKAAFSLKAELKEGRNDVNLLFTDENGKVTRQTFNFVYLTNYDLVVDQNYTGEEGAYAEEGTGAKMYRTVQSAVDSVPSSNTERTVILIKEGNYKEYLRVASPNITLIGEDREKVNINYFDAEVTSPGGDTSARCATFIKSSATGFAAENLTFENTYKYLGDGTISNESADALRVDAEGATFVNVKLLGYQDTLQANSNHQYFYKSYIAGNIDYIYGTGQTLFNDCELVFRYNSNKNSGYITAPKTDADDQYGYIFNDCRIYAEEGCSGTKYLLARPWGQDAAATFINTYMSGIINKTASYADMSGNLFTQARFSEYYSYGEGYAINGNRPPITKEQADKMLTSEFLGWDPYQASEDISAGDFVGNTVTTGEDKFIENEYKEENADPDSTNDVGLGAFNIEGYAEEVTGGGVLLETAGSYYKAASAEEFLSALAEIKKSGKASVIELTEDIGLGSEEIGNALQDYSSIIKKVSNGPLMHPTLLETGVSTLMLKNMSNLTIYSKNGSALKHVCIDINNSSNIIFRNIVFDELWEWDEGGYTSGGAYCEPGDYDRNDWDYMTIQNGSTDILIDHCTFYKAYDGVVDVKKAESNRPSNVTISWSRFLPESESSFFDEMMDLLEANPSQYSYYNKLLTKYNMTKEQIREYAAAQKKTHLIGASDTEANTENLNLTLANNYYKNSMDRMPRLRGGNAHVYNCILDASDLLKLRNSIANAEAAAKVVSNGALSTCNASVLLENTYIDGIINALASGNSASPGGYINAVNFTYYLDGKLTELTVTDNAGTEMILDIDQFISQLPYENYRLYNANTLDTRVLPYTGAGVLDMNSIQWQKTAYKDAVTEVKEYTVRFDYQGADTECETAYKVATAGQNYGELPQPERKGYTFLGWYTLPEGGDEITAKSIVSNEEDHTLYARWEVQSSIPDNDGSTDDGTPDNDGSTDDGTPDNDGSTDDGTPDNDGSTDDGTPDNDGSTDNDTSDDDESTDDDTTGNDHTVNNNTSSNGGAANNSTNDSNNTQGKPESDSIPQEDEVKVDISFGDMEAHWAKESVEYVAARGILKGTSEGKFDPGTQMTRAMFTTVLYRLAGEPETAGLNSFNDVKSGTWYEQGITWASQRGIANGVSSVQFKPNEIVTREQLVTMLYQYIKVTGSNIEITQEQIKFNDQKNTASWAEEALAYMSQTSIIKGDNNQNFNPKMPVTRAEAAAIIHRFLEKIEK